MKEIRVEKDGVIPRAFLIVRQLNSDWLDIIIHVMSPKIQFVTILRTSMEKLGIYRLFTGWINPARALDEFTRTDSDGNIEAVSSGRWRSDPYDSPGPDVVDDPVASFSIFIVTCLEDGIYNFELEKACPDLHPLFRSSRASSSGDVCQGRV